MKYTNFSQSNPSTAKTNNPRETLKSQLDKRWPNSISKKRTTLLKILTNKVCTKIFEVNALLILFHKRWCNLVKPRATTTTSTSQSWVIPKHTIHSIINRYNSSYQQESAIQHHGSVYAMQKPNPPTVHSVSI